MKHPVVPGSQTPGQFLSWRCSSFLSSPGPTPPGTDNRSAQNPKQNPWKKIPAIQADFRRILGKKKKKRNWLIVRSWGNYSGFVGRFRVGFSALFFKIYQNSFQIRDEKRKSETKNREKTSTKTKQILRKNARNHAIVLR